MAESPQKIRVLTGDRPTGRLHLGHFVGSIKNRLKFQESGAELFLIIADYHTLTTKHTREHLQAVRQNARELVLDYLSVGIDPQRATIYLQSLVPQVAEFNLLFSMLVSVNRLKRVPTLKEKVKESGKEMVGEVSLSLLGYPVLQAADILMVKADLVPVGKDQESHIEVTREIARAFNRAYGKVFPTPKAVLGESFLPGTDGGSKMGKSLGNAIYLTDDSVTVREKVMKMFTDPNRLHKDDPGRVEGNPVFAYHFAFNSDKEEVASLARRYRQGKVGDVEVKERLVVALEKFLDPIRQRRARFVRQRGLPEEILYQGTKKTIAVAQEVLDEARSAMGLDTTKL